MTAFFADNARLPDGWARDVRITVEGGRIESVEPAGTAAGAEALRGALIPSIPNLHSHAFQRGMAGLGERRTAGDDDFWSWREVMYRFLDRIGPDEAEAIATLLYIEMAEAGYSRVAEFHYLHNEPHGRPYADPLEMARAHIRAARTAGISLTLTPVLYTHSTFGGREPKPGQRRFIQSTDQYLAMVQSLAALSRVEGFDLAVSAHSLRAVTPEQLREVVRNAPAHVPIHIHVAEQTQEVEDCLAWSGERPVEWLLNHVGLSERWRLVHATHMTEHEARAAADSGAVAVLCPTTEGDLGDGFFQADVWQEAGGGLAIGTDSHVVIDPREELRLFEYGRRLVRRKRGLAASASQPHPGAALWLAAAAADDRGGGARTGRIEAGYDADWLLLDPAHPTLALATGDGLFDALVFASGPGPSPIHEAWIGGRRVTEDGRHPGREAAVAAYRAALAKLTA